MTGHLRSYQFPLISLKRKCAIGLVLLLSHTACGQLFKNIGVSSGVSFTPLEWEYRYTASEPVKNHRSEKQPAGFNLFLTADLMEKKTWTINSSLGWILKNGMFTESLRTDVSVPYKLHFISWINSMKGKIQAGKHLSFNVSLGPRVEYLLTGWDALPGFAPNDDTFYYYHTKEDVRKFALGLTGGGGFSWQMKKTTLQLSGWKNLNFKPVISARGLRDDGMGDEDFYFEMRDNTYGINLQLMFAL